MKITPIKLVAALVCASALGAGASRYAGSFAEPVREVLAAPQSPAFGHGFSLAQGSDPMLVKVADAQAPSTKNTHPLGERPSFGDIVEASAPSVVQVRVQKHAGADDGAADDEDNSLYDFLRRFRVPTPKESPKDAPKADKSDPKAEIEIEIEPPAPNKRQPKGFDAPDSAPKIPFPKPPAKPPLSGGVGSGFFIDESGYLLTNAHVVEGAQKIILRLADKSEVEARLIGADKRTDIALLKADGGGFKPLPIGNPDKSRVGDWLIAIGSPFGLEFTATAGILSAKARALPSDDSYLPFLQTDAAVNPGNSGGPLINEHGQAIGINSQIYSRSGGYMGISFAIPIDYAMKIAGKIRRSSGGSIEHGRIGAYVQDLTPELAKAFNLTGKTGAIILSVEPGSAAEKYGVKAADIIVSVDGRSILGSNEMVRLIADSDPGDKMTLGIDRKGRPVSINLSVGGPKPKAKPADSHPKSEPDPKLKKSNGANEPFGIKARPLSPSEAKTTGVSRGLKVLETTGAAESAGIEPGDLILSLDGQGVGSMSDMAKIIAAAPGGKPLALLLKRAESSLYIAMNPDGS